MTKPEALEIYRAGWRRARRALDLDDFTSKDFASGGLPSSIAGGVGARLLILPADPEAAVVAFNGQFSDWWGRGWPDPITGRRLRWGSQCRQLPDAAVRYHYSSQESEWDRYVAVHRHGGLEMVLGREAASRRVAPTDFNLIRIVGRVWQAVDFYRHVKEEFKAEGPWEVSLALPETGGAVLGGFARGRSTAPEPTTCRASALFARREVQAWPDENGAEELAFRFGDWIENAWGSRERRFLIRDGGHLPARFDTSEFEREEK